MNPLETPGANLHGSRFSESRDQLYQFFLENRPEFCAVRQEGGIMKVEQSLKWLRNSKACAWTTLSDLQYGIGETGVFRLEVLVLRTRYKKLGWHMISLKQRLRNDAYNKTTRPRIEWCTCMYAMVFISLQSVGKAETKTTLPHFRLRINLGVGLLSLP